MTVKRAAPGSNPFTVVLNEVINDDRLGADGLGILVYLISKPASWEVKIGDLRRQFGIGRDKAYKVLSHLVELGYAQRYQGRDDSGGFSDNNYLIFDRINPLPENTEAAPLPEMPYPVKPTLQKKERKQTNTIHRKAGTTKENFCNEMHNLESNFKMARKIYEERKKLFGDGFTAWSDYNNGKYLKYIN